MQRLRVRFSRGQELKFISHLDLMRLWQRALHRAGVALAYSEGYTPHPRISLAAPLALGVTSEAELMDVYCTRWVSPHVFGSVVGKELPAGVKILQVNNVALPLPSLQAQVRYADYRVRVNTQMEASAVEEAIGNLLSLEHLPWQHQRDTGPRNYDLRPLIDDLSLLGCQDGCCTIDMRLRCSSQGSGRPEQVIAALGLTGHPAGIHRTRLLLKTS
jgi:radical SAM-linked protein